jgi:polyhydroxyalkanoate synthesis regulator phasin
MRIDETNDLLQQIGTSINNLSSGLQQATSSTLEMEVRDLQRRVAELQNRVN